MVMVADCPDGAVAGVYRPLSRYCRAILIGGVWQSMIIGVERGAFGFV